MSKSEQLLRAMFIAILPNFKWQDIREKAGIDPFELDCADHLLMLMDYYRKCQEKIFDRIQIYCEQEIAKDVARTR